MEPLPSLMNVGDLTILSQGDMEPVPSQYGLASRSLENASLLHMHSDLYTAQLCVLCGKNKQVGSILPSKIHLAKSY